MTRWRLTSLICVFAGIVLAFGVASEARADCGGGGGGDGTIGVAVQKAGVYKSPAVTYDDSNVNIHIAPAVAGHTIQVTCYYGKLWQPGEGYKTPPVTVTTNEGGNATTLYLAPTFSAYDVVTAKDLSAPNQPENSDGVPVFEIKVVYPDYDPQEYDLCYPWYLLYYFNRYEDNGKYVYRDPAPAAYPVWYKLKSYPPTGVAPAPRTWNMVSGVDPAAFWMGDPNNFVDWCDIWTGAEAFLHCVDQSDEADDVDLEFTYDGTVVYRWQMDVRRPWGLQLRSDLGYPTDEPDTAQGYLTTYKYWLLDQLGRYFEVVGSLPFAESWWTGDISDWQNENWPQPEATGAWLTPDWFTDLDFIHGNYQPLPQNPHTPLQWNKVDHWGQDFWCGSTSPQDQWNQIRHHTLQSYQDHARHENPL